MRKISLPRSKGAGDIRDWLEQHKHLPTRELASRAGLKFERVMQWRVVYDVIDPKDEALFTVWINYKSYTIAEAAILAGLSHRMLRYYLKKYGITKYDESDEQFSDYRTPQIEYERVDKSILKSKSELARLQEKYGKQAISKMVGVSIEEVRRAMKKFGLSKPSRQSTGPSNPCRNREWLVKHYVVGALNLRECAALAGVCAHTIRNWLIYFGIRPRDCHEAFAVRQNPKDSRFLTCTT